MNNGPVEPAANLRMFASVLRQMFLALIAEGFSTGEAMEIIGRTIAASTEAQS